MIRRVTAGITIVLALTVAIITAVIVAGYWNELGRSDLMYMSLPVVIPLILAGIGALATWVPSKTGRTTGAIYGFCLGAILYLIFPSMQLIKQYEMIKQDGTSFWGLMELPSVYFGIPLPIIGALIGFTVGFAISRIQKK